MDQVFVHLYEPWKSSFWIQTVHRLFILWIHFHYHIRIHHLWQAYTTATYSARRRVDDTVQTAMTSSLPLLRPQFIILLSTVDNYILSVNSLLICNLKCYDKCNKSYLSTPSNVVFLHLHNLLHCNIVLHPHLGLVLNLYITNSGCSWNFTISLCRAVLTLKLWIPSILFIYVFRMIFRINGHSEMVDST